MTQKVSARHKAAPTLGLVGAAPEGPATPVLSFVATAGMFGEPNPAPAQYVVGFLLERSSERVLLVRKNRPSWQYGLLNGVGGHVELGETPERAMEREWTEEIGPGAVKEWRSFATMRSHRSIIHCFAGECNRLPHDSGYNDVGETLVAVRLSGIGLRRDCIRNLKWLLPLAFDDPNHQFVTAEMDE
jgi:8-oxo-dGTP diphosphatase